MIRTRVRDSIALDPATAPLGAVDAASREARVLLRSSTQLVALVIVLVLILIFG